MKTNLGTKKHADRVKQFHFRTRSYLFEIAKLDEPLLFEQNREVVEVPRVSRRRGVFIVCTSTRAVFTDVHSYHVFM